MGSLCTLVSWAMDFHKLITLNQSFLVQLHAGFAQQLPAAKKLRTGNVAPLKHELVRDSLS